MPPPDASGQFHRTVLKLQLLITAAGRRAWQRMDGQNMDQSWAAIAPGLFTVVSAGQLAAARAASAYVPTALEQTGQSVAPEAVVVAAAFSGIAADGRSLPGLMAGAVVRAKQSSRGAAVVDGNGHQQVLPPPAPEEALAAGGRRLDQLLHGIVVDAGRGAMQAEIAVRPNIGYVRQVNPPCCPRCAILAGKWFPWNAGFSRHPPTCDCTGIPASEDVAGSFVTDAQALFDKGLVHGLTKRERDRLDQGDDLYQVVNEQRDMWRARIAEQKAGGTPEERAARDASARQGLEDLFASTRSRVDALAAMKDQGYIR